MSGREERELRQAILKAMASPTYRPATLPDITRLFHLPKARRHLLKRVLLDLLDEDEIVRIDHRRFGLPGSVAASQGVAASRGAAAVPRAGDMDGGPRARRSAAGAQARRSAAGAQARRVVIGTVQRNPRGFGFVTPDSGGRDIYVPAHALGDVLNGDRVSLRVTGADREGRSRGEVVRVVERSRRRVMGVFRAESGRRHRGVVQAYDRLYRSDIIIPDGETGGAADGMVVGVQIVRPSDDQRPACGRIVEVLGHPDDPGIDLKTIIRKYDLKTEFPEEPLAEAARIPDEVPEAEIRRREDFRRLPIVTIDGETAMDFDDAVHVERHADGTFMLQVHIADVAHYVRPSSALDREAYARGTSVYFPGTAIPMLPEKLSNGICSLNPRVDRLVQSCIMRIDRSGKVVDHRFADGVIRTVERMTYTAVAKILVERDPATMARYRDLVPAFRLMEELCGVLQGRRRRRGSIDFDLPEPEILLEVTGAMIGIQPLERNVAHRLIEEFMLVANETVAAHLFKARIPSLYRIHERPDPRKLEEFDAVARAFGYRLPRPYETIEPAAFQGIVDMARGQPEERFLSRLMLRSMKQARYSERRDIHFGLATSCYTHFTSPIRRYPDLVIHRLLRRALAGGPPSAGEASDLEGFLPEAAQRSSRMERNADAAENELIEWKKLAFMNERLGDEFDGFIISAHPFGFFVELREFFIDGLVPIDSLPGDRYRFVEKTQIIKGERHGRVFKVGDPARVRVDKVNPFMLELDFSLVEAAPRAGGRRPARAGREA